MFKYRRCLKNCVIFTALKCIYMQSVLIENQIIIINKFEINNHFSLIRS